MIAVIHLVPNDGTSGMLTVAGRPLLERQLDWLGALGCEQILVEIGPDPLSAAVAQWLRDSGTLASDQHVKAVETDWRLGARGVASRVGLAQNASVLAIPADLLGDGDLGMLYPVANAFGAVAFFNPPKGLERTLMGGTIRLVRAPLKHRRPAMILGPGWGARLTSQSEADALGNAALRGKLPKRDSDHFCPISVLRSAAA
jgi:hypothetical protein